jgi:hypothetical protein
MTSATPSDPARDRPAARSTWLLFAAISAMLSLVVLTRPDILITSDTLPLGEFVWDLIHHGAVWDVFQQSHSPCLFPDLLIQWPIHALTGSWRIASTVLAILFVTWLTGLATWIAARLAGCGMLIATLSAALVLIPILTIAAVTAPTETGELGGSGLFLPNLFAFMPGGYHGGPALLGFTGACLASPEARLTPAVRATALAVICWGLGLSDLLGVGFLMVPLTVANLGRVWATRKDLAATASVTLISWLGYGLGMLCQLSLPRQPIQHYPLEKIPTHAGLFLVSFGRHPDMLLLLVLGFTILGRNLSRLGLTGCLRAWWPAFTTVTAAGSLCLCIGVYEDIWTFRYAQPFVWWPVFLATAWLAESLNRDPARWRMLAFPVAGGLAVVCVVLGAFPPRLLTWQVPLARCLTHAGLTAGLAPFWPARQAMAVTDWRIQIEPLGPGGEPLIWGNDRTWFAHDIHDPSRRPDYRFVVVGDLPRDKLEAGFGPADRIVRCDGQEIWVYDKDGAIWRALSRMAPDLVPPER